MNAENYAEKSRRAAERAIALGHNEKSNLRELLILTTSSTTSELVNTYFQNHRDDETLLKSLFAIAAEGEDCGDAPWAAANIIAEFPVRMLSPHKAELVELSSHEWLYLKRPALDALAKIANGT